MSQKKFSKSAKFRAKTSGVNLLAKARTLRNTTTQVSWLNSLPPKVRSQIEGIVRSKRAGNIEASWSAIAEMLITELHLTVTVETVADRIAALPLPKGAGKNA